MSTGSACRGASGKRFWLTVFEKQVRWNLDDVQLDVGVIGMVCSGFWDYGSVEAGVCGTVIVPIGGVPISGVGHGIGKLLPEEGVAMEGENC